MKRDLATRLSAEADAVRAKIDKAYDKLAAKLRKRAEKAKAEMIRSRTFAKRVIMQRRFELYANAARELDRTVTNRQASSGDLTPVSTDTLRESAQP
ncbi:hypothetical protein [Methylobacterium sp. NEAU K]|uniref:hypothetical protein n=1 Tax=Methylobacterium sp. NEAU K TaxID=3064946 RepID=UPI002733459F|nr:hypothetical protein [Methylobacterium sp. NEAU K]MDP4003315.1 hypothetical protein [Methylobacterium sp. NEAU K]